MTTVMRRRIVALAVVAVIVRLCLLVAVRNVGVHTDDERDYVKLAGSLLDGRGLAYGDRPTSMRPPLYPAFIAAVWSVSQSRSYQAIRAAQIVLSLIGILLVVYLARELFGPTVAIAAGTMWAFYPSYLYAGVLMLTEVLFTTLLLAACACAVAATRSESKSVRWALACGGLVGLAALTRSVLWPLPLVLAPLLGLIASDRWPRRLGIAVALIAAYVAVVAPWAIRNTRLQQTVVLVDTMGGMNLRMGNYEHTNEDRMWDGVSLHGEKSWSYAMVQEHPEARMWTEGQRERWARQRAIEYMRAHPVTTARRSVRKFADFWGLEREYIAALQNGIYRVPGWFKAASSAAVMLSYTILALLGCFGLLNANWGDWRRHLPGVLVIAWVAAIHTVVFGHSRYHIPVMPLVVIYAVAAVEQRAWRRAHGLMRWGAAVSAAGLLTVIWAYEVLVRDADRLRTLLALN